MVYSDNDETTAEPTTEDAENIASTLEPNHLDEIAFKVIREYEIDETNFKTRKQKIEELYKLALQVADEKTYPFQGASNIKYPLITDAALAFSAIAYPSVVKDDMVVKAKIVGSDKGGETPEGADGKPLLDEDGNKVKKNAGLKQKIADRVSKFMSYRVLKDIDGWEEDMDKILLINPIIGCSFKKTYYDPLERKAISRLVLPQYVTMDINARTEDTAARISELINLYPYEIDENIKAGVFIEFDYDMSDETKEDSYTDSDGEKQSSTHVDESLPHVFIEQHRRLDLDDDGYAEPYIVWVHKTSQKVVRIIARFDDEDILKGDDGKIIKIKAQNQYTKFGFIPDPEGSPYDIGFGHLLEDINNTVNTAINQMLDQGHRYTMGGGFIGDGLRMKSGDTKFKPGEYKRVKSKGMSIRENIVNLDMKEPSGTMMLLTESLVKAGKDISSMSDVLSGDMPANTPAVTAMANMEQGMQPFKAVFKRIHRSLKREFELLFKLEQKYLTDAEYRNILDDEEATVELDFNTGAVNVIPMSDPEMLTNTQSFLKAQFFVSLLQDPYIDPIEVRTRMFKHLNEKDIDDLVKLPAPQQPDELMETQMALLKTQMLDLKNDNARKDKELNLEASKHSSTAKKDASAAILNIAKAESEEEGTQLALYKMELDQLKEEKGNEPEGMGQVEAAADDGGVLPVS